MASVTAKDSGCAIPDQRDVPATADGSTKARRRFQSMCDTCQDRPPRASTLAPVTLAVMTRGVDGPHPHPAVQDGERRVGGEHRQQLQEVLPPIPALGFWPHKDHPRIRIQLAGLAHPRGDPYGLGRGRERQPAQGLGPDGMPHPTPLQAQRQQLLGEQVARQRGRHDRLDEALGEQPEQGGGAQQLIVVGGQEQHAAARPGAAAATPQPLQQ